MGWGPSGTWPTPSGPGVGPTAVSPASYSSMFASSSGGGMNPAALKGEYDSKYSEAKQANESRYNQGMQEYGDLYNRGMGRLDTLSNQNAADIRQNGANQVAGNNQRLQSLGLSGTTIAPTLNQGVMREQNASLNRNNDQLAEMKNSTDASLKGAQLGFLERRQDPYPDMGAYTNLMSMMGRTAAEGSGGGMGGGGAGGMSGGMSGYGGGSMDPGAQGLSSMYVANTGGSSARGGQNVYGTPQEIARATAMRASGTIATDPMDGMGNNGMYGQQSQDYNGYGTQYGSTNQSTGSRWGAPANYGGMQPQMMQKSYGGF